MGRMAKLKKIKIYFQFYYFHERSISSRIAAVCECGNTPRNLMIPLLFNKYTAKTHKNVFNFLSEDCTQNKIKRVVMITRFYIICFLSVG